MFHLTNDLVFCLNNQAARQHSGFLQNVQSTPGSEHEIAIYDSVVIIAHFNSNPRKVFCPWRFIVRLTAGDFGDVPLIEKEGWKLEGN